MANAKVNGNNLCIQETNGAPVLYISNDVRPAEFEAHGQIVEIKEKRSTAAKGKKKVKQ